ncbi:hypothetical protein bpr_II126 (plasmid) [Butyrivibrio proteoclasticus B316]|uniref:PIN domain-containing protein n=1 Tax=Butyrivibrio proteoclasticus (strain ATCC 51982 / DSM 14932 / B316) TaxID=515622 RepID=E0S3T3_BUTPB|nr:PIN domain-containing protein [Butyrivibrio proteoclasticus]ADL36065.1 hypothetical protein bpr_II126 [Butyrivibrio proteoclasticus B316]
MKIYLDNCCFNRILDDRSYPIIYLERNSVMLILELAEAKRIEIIGSEMLRKEISDTPSYMKREKLALMYSLCSSEIKVTENIVDRAIEIRDNSNIRTKDSIHLACAEAAKADVFLTTDKKFMNNANRIPAKIKVKNPTEWLMEVIS